VACDKSQWIHDISVEISSTLAGDTTQSQLDWQRRKRKRGVISLDHATGQQGEYADLRAQRGQRVRGSQPGRTQLEGYD